MRNLLMRGAACGLADGRSTSTSDAAAGDPLLTAEQGAAETGLSLAAFWRGVATGRLPAPFYPAPRAPRWRRSELRDALEATRARPREAMARRIAARSFPMA